GLVPLGAMLLSDGLPVRQETRQDSTVRWRWFAPAVTAVCAAVIGLNAYLAASDYNAGVPAGLDGMASVRLPAAQADALRATTEAASRRCSAFITYPGLTSFYLWTGQRLPSGLTDGPWMFILDYASQQAMVDQLQAIPNLCVIQDQA